MLMLEILTDNWREKNHRLSVLSVSDYSKTTNGHGLRISLKDSN